MMIEGPGNLGLWDMEQWEYETDSENTGLWKYGTMSFETLVM